MKFLPRIVLGVAFALLASLLLTGCQSPETAENEASRPWNAPRGWESGLPGFQQDRR
jgi:outer membrane biogenesis lipoprotein LolB